MLKLLLQLFTVMLASYIACSQPIKPGQADTVNYLHCYFEVPSSKNATRYSVEISTDNRNFGKHIVAKSSGSTNLLFIGSGLSFGRKYYWRHLSSDSNGNTATSEPSSFYIVSDTQNGKCYRNNILVNDSQRHSGGYIVLDNGIVTDREGTIIWVMPKKDRFVSIRNLQLNSDGNLSFTDSKLCFEINLKGEVLWQSPSIVRGIALGDYHHDFTKLKNGNFLCLAEKARKKNEPIYNVIFEITRENEIVWLWDEEEVYSGNQDFKGSHINSIMLDENDGNLYISNRDLTSIAKINAVSGKMLYTVGKKQAGGAPFYLNEFFNGQHALSVLKTGELLLFNNNTDQSRNGGASSILVLTQPTERNAPTIVWEYVFNFGSERENFSGKLGDADKQPNGNILVYAGNSGRTFEVTPTREIAWQCITEEYDLIRSTAYPITGYRAQVALSLYPQVDR